MTQQDLGRGKTGAMTEPAETIVCVDCGGDARLLNRRYRDPEAPDEPLWSSGDVAAYRCRDCLDRWDLVLTDDDLDPTRDAPDY